MKQQQNKPLPLSVAVQPISEKLRDIANEVSGITLDSDGNIHREHDWIGNWQYFNGDYIAFIADDFARGGRHHIPPVADNKDDLIAAIRAVLK